jgi:GNAT superfamily N-acetyltransferase
MNCQIVHDSIHSRAGWTEGYLMEVNGEAVGFGSIAKAGPWKERRTLLEFYLLPTQRTRAFEFCERFIEEAKPVSFEVQSNDALATVMALTFARTVESESIVFKDHHTTNHSGSQAVLRGTTDEKEIVASIQERAGGGEWMLDLDGQTIGRGGILFHYNEPYGDIYMDIDEPFRRQGFGAFLVQELKRTCYALGAIPGARCNPANVASRRTLSRAGFAPYAHLLVGSLR